MSKAGPNGPNVFILVTQSLRKPTELHHKPMVYYYANHKLRDVFFFSALHNISAFNFHKKTQALSQPQQNWHLCTEKLYSCQFLSCEVLSKSCVCCFPPHMQLTPFFLLTPQGKVPIPCSGTAAEKEQEPKPLGWSGGV